MVFPTLLLLSFVAGEAGAQVSASATLESDDVVRGVSLDAGRPDARFSLSYDHPSGVYGGVSGLFDDTAQNGLAALGYIGYLGYAHQFGGEISLDSGISNAGLNIDLPASATGTPGGEKYHANYTELYGGVVRRDLSARLYFSPDYLGEDFKAIYLDLTQSFRFTDHLHAYVHAGVLTPLSTYPNPDNSGHERFDLGTGAAWAWRHGELKLGWSGVSRDVRYPVDYRQSPSRFVLGLTGFF